MIYVAITDAAGWPKALVAHEDAYRGYYLGSVSSAAIFDTEDEAADAYDRFIAVRTLSPPRYVTATVDDLNRWHRQRNFQWARTTPAQHEAHSLRLRFALMSKLLRALPDDAFTPEQKADRHLVLEGWG